MFKRTVLCISRTEAVRYAAQNLAELGICVTQKAAPDVTHLLLPVPSFPTGDEYLAHYLAELPDDVIITGGNLQSPLLEHYCCVDFLQDSWYLAQNAAITAQCAVQLLEERLPSLAGKAILILGWGRIGKCLGSLLRSKGANVTISARKITDLAMIRALGCHAIPTDQVRDVTMHYDAILNTIPELVLPGLAANSDCVCIELASKPGMTGSNILSARGLPGKMAPEQSGKLIAETFIRLAL